MKFSATPYHLYGADVLPLLHVYVSEVEPDVRQVCCGLPHLGKHVPRLTEVALVCQHRSYTRRMNAHIMIYVRMYICTCIVHVYKYVQQRQWTITNYDYCYYYKLHVRTCMTPLGVFWNKIPYQLAHTEQIQRHIFGHSGSHGDLTSVSEKLLARS